MILILQLFNCVHIFNLYSLVSVLSRHLVMISISVGKFSVMFSRLLAFAKIKFFTTVDVDSDLTILHLMTKSHDPVRDDSDKNKIFFSIKLKFDMK